jgi:hypothetical protein
MRKHADMKKAGERSSFPVSWSAPASAGWVNKICD